LEARVFGRWVLWADRLRDDKDLRGAERIAEEILKKRRPYDPAEKSLAKTRGLIRTIEQRRNELIGLGSFPEALNYVVNAWPKEEDEQKKVIVEKGLAWVEARRKAGEVAKAE